MTNRQERNDLFARLFADAQAAGLKAGEEAVPVPMIVVEHEDIFDDNSAVAHQYVPVMDGVCGFAWVNIRPGNSAVANFAKKHVGARKAYRGGVNIWCIEFGQSYTRKMAWAIAFAKSLSKGLAEAGFDNVRVWGQGRLD